MSSAFPSFRQITRETRRGKSIARILSNHALHSSLDGVGGTILDLASGDNASYIRLLDLSRPGVRLIRFDYDAKHKPEVLADLRQNLPIRAEAASTVLCCSFLYTIRNPAPFLAEVRRVLVKGGQFVGVVPFVFPYTPEPTDFWRYTGEGLRSLFEDNGFENVAVTPYGGRFTAIAYILNPFLARLQALGAVAYWLAIKLDALASRKPALNNLPIGYVVRAVRM